MMSNDDLITTIIEQIRLTRASVKVAYDKDPSATLFEWGAISAYCQILADINPGVDVLALTKALSDLGTDLDDYLEGVGLLRKRNDA